MRPLKDFKTFVKEGIVKKQSIDRNRAESLINNSENSLRFLKKIMNNIELIDDYANSVITDSYDIMMNHIRAKMLLKGFNSSGIGAHEAEVAYLKELGFPKQDITFMNQLRYFRNGILYYGKEFDKEYALKVVSFMDKFIPKLKKIGKLK